MNSPSSNRVTIEPGVKKRSRGRIVFWWIGIFILALLLVLSVLHDRARGNRPTSSCDTVARM